VLPSSGVFSLAGSFRCLFLLLFLGALYVAWVLFYVGLFSVRTFFFCHEDKQGDVPLAISFLEAQLPFGLCWSHTRLPSGRDLRLCISKEFQPATAPLEFIARQSLIPELLMCVEVGVHAVRSGWLIGGMLMLPSLPPPDVQKSCVGVAVAAAAPEKNC
jgi:hypothetical protein